MSSTPPPIIILGTGRSFTSVICCMIGEHPDLIGLPETNIFRDDTLGAMLKRFGRGPNRRRLAGLLRSIAHFHEGAQTDETIAAAEEFLEARADWSYREIAHYLAEQAAPQGIVEKSISTCRDTTTLNRVREAWPDAYYLHITRQPESIMNSMQNRIDDALEKGKGKKYGRMMEKFSLDEYYLRFTSTILDFMETLPQGRCMNLHGEEFLTDAAPYLRQICEWTGLDADDAIIEGMMHPENNPFAHRGPDNAHGGLSGSFIENPKYSGKPVVAKPISFDTSSPGASGYRDTIARLGYQLGYR
ncbi:sulfotransferase [Shimia sp.]|uniref:sulfotransferase family protein n=1 Tax=Shimia sp. TaxID=1954381 RepID=UPI00356AE116